MRNAIASNRPPLRFAHRRAASATRSMLHQVSPEAVAVIPSSADTTYIVRVGHVVVVRVAVVEVDVPRVGRRAGHRRRHDLPLVRGLEGPPTHRGPRDGGEPARAV